LKSPAALHGPHGMSQPHGDAADQFPRTLEDWERRCQKPDHRRVGNWLARRVARPAALQITRLVVPWGITPHLATFTAWGVGLAAIVALGWGTPAGWIAGAVLLHLWYLLDHVDGQLARFYRCETLDGAQLDYLMHHTINLLLPVGIGWGVAGARHQPPWTLLGVAAGVGLLLLGLIHDTRYKAFVKRWKRLRGELVLQGGGGGRPAPPARPAGSLLRRVAWCLRKLCEVHCILIAVPPLALAMYLTADVRLTFGGIYLILLAAASLLLSAVSLVRGLRNEATEREFAAWFHPAEGCYLTLEDGWWEVRRLDEFSRQQ